MSIILKPNGKDNYNCDNCGKSIYVKPSRIKRTKRICCSMKCSAELRRIWFTGENNHQYGLTNNLNATYIGKDKKVKNSYVFIRDFSHPFAQDGGWFWEHRAVVEKHLLTDENSVIINNKKYLDPRLHVHHKDENKQNNDPNNLEIMTKGEHTSLHNKLRKIKNKKISNFIKKDEKRMII